MFFIEMAFVVFLGLALGSFATALSYRLPREISIVTRARSQCPSCGHVLESADLVPLFSWVFLRGKCRHCRAHIGMRYPLIELATLALCLLFFFVYGLSAQTIFVFALAPVLVAIIDIDLWHQIIPDSLNTAIAVIGIVVLAVNAGMAAHPVHFLMTRGIQACCGVLAYGGGAWLLRAAAGVILKREALGLGDVKFFAAAGFWLGLNAMEASFLMIVSGGAGVILALLWKKRGDAAEVPFGPSLVIAFIFVLCLYRSALLGV